MVGLGPALAQREADNWIVTGTWFNFNGGNPPTVQPAPQPALFGTGSTISNAAGQLLFFFDNGFVYNRNHRPMPYHFSVAGGINIHGADGITTPAKQGALIVPWPGRDSLYILFHINHNYVNNFNSSLQYSIINMNRDSGRGDVQQADIPLLGGTNVCLKLSAVLHCNKKDVWVTGHLKNSDKYYSFLVTASGVNTTPVYSTCNMVPDGIGVNGRDENHYGNLKISAAGNRLAAAHLGLDYVELCDYNSQTGQVSNPKKLYLKPSYANYYPALRRFGAFAVDFSPSGDRLYASGLYYSYYLPIPSSTPRPVDRKYQFNAALATEAAIQASRYLIDTTDQGCSSMQIANDGKMYMVYQHLLVSTVGNPEGLGAACNYTFFALAGIGVCSGNLPSLVQSYFRYNIVTNGNCQGQAIQFNLSSLSGISGIAWDFGDPGSGANNTATSATPLHVFSAPGLYTVKVVLQNSNGCAADTVVKVVHAGPIAVSLGNDTTICSGDTLRLRPMGSPPGSVLLWSNNSTDTVLKITQPGQYWVKVNFGGCSVVDTINVGIRPLPQFTLGNDTVICSNNNLTIAPNPTYAGNFLWSDGTTLPTATVNTVGNHWLQITDNLGCSGRDTINVQFKTLPNFNLGNDTVICQRDTLLLNATVNGATGYTWNTGAISPQIKTYQSGVYWCDVNNNGCIYRDSLQLGIKPRPMTDLGKDTTLCENTSLLLDALYAGSSYLWSNGSTSGTLLVNEAGNYGVAVTLNGCTSKDSISIAYELLPRFSLGVDKLICTGETITLQPTVNPLWQLLWQDGSNGATYSVTKPGLYYLDATTRCGTVRDEVLFTQGLCKVYIPNAFTPNGDGRNDVLKVLGTALVTNFNFKIFNRYGQLVFETKDKNKGWDGLSQGRQVNNGTYIYNCSYQLQNGTIETITGTLVVMR
jgi:gliding motility-associated-like protein